MDRQKYVNKRIQQIYSNNAMFYEEHKTEQWNRGRVIKADGMIL